jgi:hypothetical protein
VPLSVGFRRLPLGSVLPCGVRTFLDAPYSEEQSAPRSPGLQAGLYPALGGADSPVQAH